MGNSATRRPDDKILTKDYVLYDKRRVIHLAMSLAMQNQHLGASVWWTFVDLETKLVTSEASLMPVLA